MDTARAVQDTPLIDFQKTLTREDSASSILNAFNAKDMGFVAFFSLLRDTKTALKDCLVEALKADYKQEHLRALLAKLIEVYCFRRFVLKDRRYEKCVEVSKLPSAVLEDLQKQYIKDNLENGLHQFPVKIARGSAMDAWIRSTYLSLAAKVFRGVFSYSVNIRYVFNKPDTQQEWQDRYFNRYANFHWDAVLNSFTMIIYLSDVADSDGAFRIIKDSQFYSQNLYLSMYDRLVSDIVGLRAHICSDRVGSFIEENIADKELCLSGSAGTVIQFYGRHIAHDGGYPEVGGSRIALFVDQRNYMMKPLQLISRLLTYAV